MVYQRAVSLFLCRKYRSDISGITTKAPCEAALMGERHVRIEISDFVMRTFVRTPVSILQKEKGAVALTGIVRAQPPFLSWSAYEMRRNFYSVFFV